MLRRVVPATPDLADFVDYVAGGIAADIVGITPVALIAALIVIIIQYTVCASNRCPPLDYVTTIIMAVGGSLLYAFSFELARVVVLRCHCYYRSQVPEDPQRRAAITWSKLWSMAAGSAHRWRRPRSPRPRRHAPPSPRSPCSAPSPSAAPCRSCGGRSVARVRWCRRPLRRLGRPLA